MMDENPFKDSPHGWIQWKGTDVCMDCYCSCGAHFHIDRDFCYYIQCRKCNQVYEVNGYVKFHPIESVPKGHVEPRVDAEQEL